MSGPRPVEGFECVEFVGDGDPYPRAVLLAGLGQQQRVVGLETPPDQPSARLLRVAGVGCEAPALHEVHDENEPVGVQQEQLAATRRSW